MQFLQARALVFIYHVHAAAKWQTTAKPQTTLKFSDLGPVARRPISAVSFSCVQKHFLGEFFLSF